MPPKQKETPWRAYIEDWGMLFERSGLPRIAGRIWGWLLVCEPAHQSPEQLASVLHVSRASVSTNVRLLEQAGLIEPAAIPGARRTYIRIRPDAYDALMREKLDATVLWRRLAERGLEMARTARVGAPPRLEALREFYAFIETEQQALMRRWEQIKRRGSP